MSKVKSRLPHDVAPLQPPTNVPTKYELLTPYSFQDTAHPWRNDVRHIMNCPELIMKVQDIVAEVRH